MAQSVDRVNFVRNNVVHVIEVPYERTESATVERKQIIIISRGIKYQP